LNESVKQSAGAAIAGPAWWNPNSSTAMAIMVAALLAILPPLVAGLAGEPSPWALRGAVRL
jgi:hypothetical protein